MSRSRKPTERRQLHSWTLDAAISLCRDQQYLLKRQEEMIEALVVRNRQFARSCNVAEKELVQLRKSNEALEKKLKRAKEHRFMDFILAMPSELLAMRKQGRGLFEYNEKGKKEEDERESVSSDDSIEHEKSAVKTNEKLQAQDC